MNAAKRTGNILERARKGIVPDLEEIRHLLTLTCPEALDRLHLTARQVREACFGREIFFYGFVYFSTWCRNRCRFCQYRQDNRQIRRYRKPDEDIITSAVQLADAGVHLIDLTMGEDPGLMDTEQGIRRLCRLTAAVKKQTGLPVMLSPGVMGDRGIRELGRAGADWYACYQETHSRLLFEALRPGQSYDLRMRAKETAGQAGMLVEEGILTGVGETVDDIVHSICRMRESDASQVRVMTFVPQAGTPMAGIPVAGPHPQGGQMEKKIISVMRLTCRNALIPASLDIDGLSGLSSRLDAGANVITSMVVPGKGFAGVANASLDIDNARRTPARVARVLDRHGLRAAHASTYKNWVSARKRTEQGRHRACI